MVCVLSRNIVSVIDLMLLNSCILTIYQRMTVLFKLPEGPHIALVIGPHRLLLQTSTVICHVKILNEKRTNLVSDIKMHKSQKIEYKD